MTDTLAPCPFCGERAETDFIPEHHSYQIECSDSIGCTARITRDSEFGAIEAWNCRAALAAPAQAEAPAGVEAVGEMRASESLGVAPYADIWGWLQPGTKLYSATQVQAMPLTQKEIIGMAREAGIEVHPRKDSIRIGSAILTGCDSTEEVTRFAALVAAKAAAEEREACTAACEKIKQQAEAIAKSRFMTDAGKDLHNAIAAGAHNCILAIAARGFDAEQQGPQGA